MEKTKRGAHRTCQQNALRILENLLEGMSIEGVPFVEAASYGLKLKRARGLGRAQTPRFANRMLTERLL